MNINIIVNSVNDAHSISRIQELEANGCTVKAFGFLREDTQKTTYPITILGEFNNTLSYHKRIAIYFQGLRNLFRQPQATDTLWYYLGLDVAMFASWLNPCKRYIYEECDLTHTYVGNTMIRSMLECIDKQIIRRSRLTLMTSEGFIDYHYKGAKPPKHIILAPNFLPKSLLTLPSVKSRPFDPAHIRFAFVGAVRYDALLRFANIILNHFPQHEFHFHGYIASKYDKQQLPVGRNIFYHGAFKNPIDLPSIYSNIDVLVATYDIDEDNVKYLEPNKLYEAIYFRKPLLASRNTFLERKLERMGIGTGVDTLDESDVTAVVEHLPQSYNKWVDLLKAIPQSAAVETGKFTESIKKTMFPKP